MAPDPPSVSVGGVEHLLGLAEPGDDVTGQDQVGVRVAEDDDLRCGHVLLRSVGAARRW